MKAKAHAYRLDRSKFRGDLKDLLNTHSMENGSNTPDVVLARYLTDCLEAFDRAVRSRDEFTEAGRWRRR